MKQQVALLVPNVTFPCFGSKKSSFFSSGFKCRDYNGCKDTSTTRNCGKTCGDGLSSPSSILQTLSLKVEGKRHNSHMDASSYSHHLYYSLDIESGKEENTQIGKKEKEKKKKKIKGRELPSTDQL